MKKVSRVLALLGAAVMLMGVCTACNGGTGSSSADPDAPSVKGLGGITVKMAFPYEIVMTPGLSAENDAFISRVGEVEKKYDCKIEFVYKSQTDYYNTLVQNCLAGQPTGDVINVGSSRLPDYARKGILEPLEGYDAYKQYLGNQLSKKASDWWPWPSPVRLSVPRRSCGVAATTPWPCRRSQCGVPQTSALRLK